MGSPAVDQVRRRSRRALPHQAGSARGQGAAGRVAGAEGSGLQRGQDARRHPRRGLRLPRVQRPPLRQQAADQAEQGGSETDPGTAPHRAAVPARDQRSGGDQDSSTRSSGAGPPTTGHRYPPRSSARWTTTCGGSPTSGPRSATANKPTSWVVHRYFGKFNKARQDRWVFGDRTSGAYHAQVRLDQHRPTPDRQARGVTRRPCACRVLGPATAQDAPADQPHRHVALPSPGRLLRDLREHAPRRRGPATNPARVGTLAGDHPQDDRHRVGPRHVGQG